MINPKHRVQNTRQVATEESKNTEFTSTEFHIDLLCIDVAS